MGNRNLSSGLAADLDGGHTRPAVLVKIGSADGDVLMWTGLGPLTWNGMTFQGTGALLEISAIEEAADVAATGITIGLNGIPSALVSYALSAARQGAAAVVWFGTVTAGGALVDTPIRLFNGRTDVPEIDDDPERPRITITAESRMIDARRSRVRRYTPEDQALTDPDDLGFDFVAGLQEKEFVFGKS